MEPVARYGGYKYAAGPLPDDCARQRAHDPPKTVYLVDERQFPQLGDAAAEKEAKLRQRAGIRHFGIGNSACCNGRQPLSPPRRP